MKSDLLHRMKSDPVGFVKRVFYKLVLGPLRYRRGEGYEAETYWRDRFRRYGRSYKAVGHEGLSEDENASAYAEAAREFLRVCEEQGVDFANARVLDIGCGTGFYAALLRDAGVKHYRGIDVTDVFFPSLRQEFPSFEFLRCDVTAERLTGSFNLVIIIDVTEHIVEDHRLSFAMDNIRRCLSEDGLVLLAQPLSDPGEKDLFYLRFWSLSDIQENFPGYSFSDPVPFRNGILVSIRKGTA